MRNDSNIAFQGGRDLSSVKTTGDSPEISIALLTGGADRPYVYGLATALASAGAALDLIGSDDLDCADFHDKRDVHFLNLRGDQNTQASILAKAIRVLKYYVRLIRYAATARPRLFHILWNNKFEYFDRTLLMLYYKALGKKIALTVHNVNSGVRDRNDTYFNRLTLKIQYRLADCLFVHTGKMKNELSEQFGVDTARVTIIPFGINNAVPNTALTSVDARRRLGIGDKEKVILFFGNITPYKGLEFLVGAFQRLKLEDDNYRLIIAGRPDNCNKYWAPIRQVLTRSRYKGRVLLRDEFIPDDETEMFFKAADVLVLPYTHVYQSGVMFLGYSFGLPVLAGDVGSLRDDVIEGETGLVFRPQDTTDLARALETYFTSELYANLSSARQRIKDYASERHSWNTVAEITTGVYADLLQLNPCEIRSVRETSGAAVDVNAPS